MKLPITREQALELVKKYNKDQSNINHYLETEAIMRALAKRLGEDVEYWGMLGLLHDLDWELVKDDIKNILRGHLKAETRAELIFLTSTQSKLA